MLKYKIILVVFSLLIMYYNVLATGDKQSFFSSLFVFYGMLQYDYERTKRTNLSNYMKVVQKWGARWNFLPLCISFGGLTKLIVIFSKENSYYIKPADVFNVSSLSLPLSWSFSSIGFITLVFCFLEFWEPRERSQKKKKEIKSSEQVTQGQKSISAGNSQVEGR